MACCQFFKEFSFPGGIGSHCTPETPGSIHEGGELVIAFPMLLAQLLIIPIYCDCRGGRWRIGNRTAGDLLAFQ